MLILFKKKMELINKRKKLNNLKETYCLLVPTAKNSYVPYSSINIIEPSRRDDIISLAFFVIYLQNKTLPWIKQKENSLKQRYKETLKLKSLSKIKDIACGDASKVSLLIFRNIFTSPKVRLFFKI